MTGTTLTPFHYGDERVRAYEDEEGTAWFIATDVARILGYHNAADVIRGVDEDEKGMEIVHTPGGKQNLSTISEAGLVTVLMRARVEAAKRLDETSSGQVREVYAYTEADRPIFDRAWGRSYVKGFPEKKTKKNKEKK